MMKLVCIDFQEDFTSKGYDSVEFVNRTLVPHLRDRGIKLAEIISDYRQPRPGDPRDICRPGTPGYNSGIPRDVKEKYVWIKAMNSPLWTRENAGNAERTPGKPFQDPEGLGKWLTSNVGEPEIEIMLIGLTLDSCILSAAQEFRWRGFDISILAEATDPASGDATEKRYLMDNAPVTNWARVVHWGDVRELL